MVDRCNRIPYVFSAYHTVEPTDHINLAIHFYGSSAAPQKFTLNESTAKFKPHFVDGTVRVRKFCILGPESIIRADADENSVDLNLGYFTIVSDSVILKPPLRMLGKESLGVTPLCVGDYVYIGANTIIESSRVGSPAVVEHDCVLGAHSSVGDGVWIKPDTVVPPGMTLLPHGVYAGNPAMLVGLMHPETGFMELRSLVHDTCRRLGVFSDE